MATRAVYRAAAGRALGPFYSSTATSGSTLTIVELAVSPFKTTIAADERFENYAIHRPDAAADANKSRTVKTYDAAAGQFTPDNAYSVAPYAAGVGEAIELIGVLDADTIHRLVNDALKLTDVMVDVTFTPGSGTTQHSLATAAPWLDDPDRVYQVGYLASGEAFADVDPYQRVVRGEAIRDNGTVYLTGFSLPTTVTAYVKVARPAYTYCKASAGSYGGLTSGLTAETDEAVPQAERVAAGVRMLAWDEFRDVLWPGDRKLALEELAVAADRFWSLERDLVRRPTRLFRPLRAWGPSRGFL